MTGMVDLQSEFHSIRQAFFSDMAGIDEWDVSEEHPEGCAAPVLRHDESKKITVAPWVPKEASADEVAFSLIVTLGIGVHGLRLDDACERFLERAIFTARRLGRFDLANRLLEARVAMARESSFAVYQRGGSNNQPN